ncbi:hypothetical protein SAMN02745247_02181 [Butyrivibrio hungatei DSM 14810]|uniref:Transposase, YhgA-like n=1 Tax=Butyrivibrio hungatei DSM 14810 TaxID=1121132 RepID=A0A1M7SP13_9FIRM|nr:hypothetical protein [Butyrivibrio hungatei]SHN60146.1 hypothetical protein SAMN02745247_02181 [Butyrivibrio hungatei DSM 14810]
MTIENQKYKDTVFRKLFHDKERLLELYNGVNHSNYDNPDDLEITTLEGNTFLNMKNDLSFIIDYELSLYEHQSTPCPNIPLRNLEYVASIYREIIPIEETYKTKKIDIPTPRFITFYNGAVKMEDEKIYKLSDLYHKSTDNPELELIVKVININEGHNKELMDDCKTLKEYSIFVAKVRKCIKEEKSNVKVAITRAVDECINEDILKDFLLQNREEVIEMGVLGYNAEKHLQVIQDESFDDGVKVGEEKLARLIKWLIENDRSSDIIRVTEDSEYRKQLLEDFELLVKN